MRKLTLLLFFIGFTSFAQIVYIPDPVFKYQLTHSYYFPYTGYDTNDDGEIQLTEAANITSLTINNQYIGGVLTYVTDLTGIRDFINLQTLTCQGRHIASIDLHDMTQLKSVNCAYNSDFLTNLDVSGCTNLQTLTCEVNPLTTLNLTGCTALKIINSNYTLLTHVDLSNLVSLEVASFRFCQLVSLLINNNPALKSLACDENPTLQTLDVTQAPNLEGLTSQNNGFLSLAIHHLPKLRYVDCRGHNLYGSLTSLDLSGLPALEILDISRHKITSLDFSEAPKLEELNCSYNQIGSLDMTHQGIEFNYLTCDHNKIGLLDLKNTNIYLLKCGDNLFTELDLSWQSNLQSLSCNNTTLIYLNILHNDGRWHLEANSIGLQNNPNLSFICADDWQVSTIKEYLGAIERHDVGVSSNCTFNPHVYPNPVIDVVHIMAPEKIFVTSLFDSNGKLLNTHYGSSYLESLDMSGYSSGIYYVRIESANFSNTVKLLKT